MKILSIGDLHGLNCWKFIDFKPYDKVIFIGDYCDAWSKTNEQIFGNLLDIIELKKSDPDKFILLLGNHDVQYFVDKSAGCSGYRQSMAVGLRHIFLDNIDLFTYAYQTQNVLWTHAGASNGYIRDIKYALDIVGYSEGISLATSLNMISKTKESWRLHKVGRESGGNDIFGGIMWARNVHKNMIPGIHQIYGHTEIYKIETIEDDINGCSATNIDCLVQSGNQVLEIEIGDADVKTWKELNPEIIKVEN